MSKQCYPEPTVGAVIVNAGGKLLLTKSHKWRDRYVIPGGHIELGESMEQALRREIKEETGLDIFDIRFLGFQEFIHDAAFWKRRHFIFFDFTCRTDTSEVVLNDEAQSYVWVSCAEALTLPVEPYTAKTIKTYISAYSIDAN